MSLARHTDLLQNVSGARVVSYTFCPDPIQFELPESEGQHADCTFGRISSTPMVWGNLEPHIPGTIRACIPSNPADPNGLPIDLNDKLELASGHFILLSDKSSNEITAMGFAPFALFIESLVSGIVLIVVDECPVFEDKLPQTIGQQVHGFRIGMPDRSA
jgi:hypothetical protein